MFGPDPIGADTVGSLVASAWGLDVESVEYAAIGYGSYHWHATAAGSRWLVTADLDDEQPVAAAYELTHHLGERFGFVRSPFSTSDGLVVVEDGGWLVSLWPWVTGRGGAFDDEQSSAEVAAVAACLRLLHGFSEVQVVPELIDDWDLPGRSRLEGVLDRRDENGATGPYASEMVERLAANRARLLDMLAQFDGLVAQVRDGAELVITHGEPHVANVVHAESGVVLIDWDTVRWAPRERDLWWLPGESWRETYGLDEPISEPAIEMYRLRWTLVDVADFVPALLAAPEATPDLEVAVEWIRRMLPLE